VTPYNFTPNLQGPFQFSPTLDNTVYNAIVTWNLSGRRFYLNLFSLDGVRILTTAVVGSPTGFNLASLVWELGEVTVTTEVPHGHQVGETVRLDISGVSPAGYNGSYYALITGPSTFTYRLPAFPGSVTTFGLVDYNISLVAGFFASTLVYRQANNQFEVSP